jgi:hypothetical protein
MYANNARCFSFNGSANNESLFDEYVVRRAKTSWTYFSFNYLVSGSKTTVTYAVNSQIGYVFDTPIVYSFQAFTIKVGNTDPMKTCQIRFRIFNFEIIYANIDMYFGKDPLIHGLSNVYPFYVLYKLNMSPFARNFVNLLDYKSGKLMATIISPQKSRIALNFPRTGYQIYRYTFGLSPIQVFYDSKIIPKSPISNSYTFFMNYKAVGTNYLAKNCRTVNSCFVHDYKFVFYSRANSLTPSKPFIQASRT